MGFFNAIKRAFGFGDADSFYNEEYDTSTAIYAADTEDEPASALPPTPPVFEKVAHDEEEEEPADRLSEEAAESTETTAAQESAQEKKRLACSVDTLPADLFDAVIELFNDFQPAFVRECLSVEKERERLIAGLAERLESAGVADDTASAERIAELEALVAARDHTIREDRRYRDSLERQKASLLERIEALEETAQRKRALGLRPGNRPESEPAADTETKAVTDNKENETAAPTESTSEDTLDAAGSETSEIPAGKESADNAEELARLKAEVEKLTTVREQFELKSRMSDKMLTDLRNTAAAARRELDEAREAHQAEIEALMTEHRNALADIEREQTEAAGAILSQLSEFEGLKSRLEERIAELKTSLKAEREKSGRLADEVNSLRATIETNLYNQANSEMRLRSEIKQLRSQIAPAANAAEALASDGAAIYHNIRRAAQERTAAAMAAAETTDSEQPAGVSISLGAETPAATSVVGSEEAGAPEVSPAAKAAETPKRRRGRPRKQEFDAELDNPTGFMPSVRKDDPEFGYHEPPRRPANDSAAQLSLF